MSIIINFLKKVFRIKSKSKKDLAFLELLRESAHGANKMQKELFEKSQKMI